MKYEPTYRLFPLGDSAITVDFGNVIDEDINKKVMSWFHHLSENPLPGTVDIVPAYSSLTLHYDMLTVKRTLPKEQRAYDWMTEQLDQRLQQPITIEESNGQLVRIPVCYESEYAADMEELVTHCHLPADEIIHIHQSRQYRVYMLGFLPGFTYLGLTDDKIAMPRKPQPVQVSAGAVGIAGNQTGIYPIASPGGWNIIGRTPLQLFDINKEHPALVKPGDMVQFYSITSDEFKNY
jgi:inhibitor of KinA